MGLCVFSLPISLVMIERIYTLSYYHHQIISMNYHPFFRVTSWNNGMRCISLYILIIPFFILSLLHSAMLANGHMNTFECNIDSLVQDWSNSIPNILVYVVPKHTLSCWSGVPQGLMGLPNLSPGQRHWQFLSKKPAPGQVWAGQWAIQRSNEYVHLNVYITLPWACVSDQYLCWKRY